MRLDDMMNSAMRTFEQTWNAGKQTAARWESDAKQALDGAMTWGQQKATELNAWASETYDGAMATGRQAFVAANQFVAGVEALATPNHEFDHLDGQQWVVMPDGSVKSMEEYDPAVDGEAIHHTNGVKTTPDGATGEAAALAAAENRPVILTYNATNGFVFDVIQSAVDKLNPFGVESVAGLDGNPATAALSDDMYAAARSGEPKDFVAYSQGTIIARNALMRTHARLFGEKFAEVLSETGNPLQAAIEAKSFADSSMQNVKLVTAASAAWYWPPYANVHHISNVNDFLINQPLGQNAMGDPRELVRMLTGVDLPFLRTRNDLELIRETDGSINHGFEAIYLDDVARNI